MKNGEEKGTRLDLKSSDFDSAMMPFARRAWLSVRTLPDGRGWWESVGISLVAVLLIGVIAFAAGLAHWQPRFDGWPLRLLGVMVVPAFSEELIFRALLIPARSESRHPARWFLIGIAAFVAWHVIEAMTFLPGARLFLQPTLLLCAAILGVACAAMRYRTGSLWPAVLLHALVVFAWQTALGGPSVKDLI